MKRTTIILLLTLLSISVLSAQTTWKADKSHSRVGFTVTHMIISELTGGFTDFDVTIVTTKDDFSDAKIEAVIKTTSINTDNEYRDKHLRSDDFFNAEKFPDMTFKSTKIEKAGADTYNITGDLTIRDVTKPVILNANYRGQVTSGGRTKAGFKATTTIDRFEFGTKWNAAIETGGFVVGKSVDITLLMELNKQQPAGEAPPKK